jgi:phage head maturation protease
MIEGYAVLFGVPSLGGCEPGRPHCEVIDPGAITNLERSSITGKPIFAVLNHASRGERIADTTSGLLLTRDDKGIRFILDCPMPEGLTGASFRFYPLAWRQDTSLLVRVTSADLREISLITRPFRPAWPGTLATIRSIT